VEENFHQLYERNYGQIHRFFQRKVFSQRKLFSPEDSHELTQETFVSVFKGLKGFRQEAPFKNWLFSIASNIWRSEVRRRINDVILIPIDTPDEAGGSDRPPPVAPPVDPAPGPLDSTIDKEKRQMLYEAMRQLSPQRRRCVELRIIDGLSYNEIAKLMGISIGSVKAHLHEAKKKLGEQLKPYFGEIEL
jgi:RNA polymerase sigma-70 factor (ECF subfamily)